MASISHPRLTQLQSDRRFHFAIALALFVIGFELGCPDLLSPLDGFGVFLGLFLPAGRLLLEVLVHAVQHLELPDVEAHDVVVVVHVVSKGAPLALIGEVTVNAR